MKPPRKIIMKDNPILERHVNDIITDIYKRYGNPKVIPHTPPLIVRKTLRGD